jgi:hypothetical protein
VPDCDVPDVPDVPDEPDEPDEPLSAGWYVCAFAALTDETDMLSSG